ncbi:MAG: exosortase/archaeosortase family protein [Syntrophaceae bacterium]|nr:exosortase/archaeosortase family protein [Syntrophaceae bacterium]
MIRNFILFGTTFVLLHLANITGALSYLARPMVVYAAKALDINAVDRGSEIVLGKLLLPWTQDCSGINALIMLLVITLWVNRNERFGLPLITRLVMCLPAALLANVFRILTLAAYRYVFYPNWESQQLHYFIGFLWLVPFLVFFVKDFKEKDWAGWLEIFYMAVVLAILSPVVFTPGGSIVAISTLFFLAQNRLSVDDSWKRRLAYLLWGAAAFLIGWSRMESLWIPWLLLCPGFVDYRLLRNWSGIVILSGTVYLASMHRVWQIVVLTALAYELYVLLKGRRKSDLPAPSSSPKIMEGLVILVLLLTPFILPDFIGIKHKVEAPPSGAMAKQLSFNSYELRVIGQPSDITLFWYGAFGDGRHHNVSVCMRYQGVTLKPSDEQKDVFTDGRRLMREFFIQNGKLITNYKEYLMTTVSPLASPGVHIIFDAPSKVMNSKYFDIESKRLVKRLYQIYTAESAI